MATVKELRAAMPDAKIKKTGEDRYEVRRDDLAVEVHIDHLADSALDAEFVNGHRKAGLVERLEQAFQKKRRYRDL